MKLKKTQKPFDKYDLYHRSVQSPQVDVEFFNGLYRRWFGRPARVFREDFCGTFAVCCEWVKLRPENIAIGVDLDGEPIKYGKQAHYRRLQSTQQTRVQILKKDVRDAKIPQSQITVALNFSYYLFKERNQLREYFKSAHRNLFKKGLFVIDAFGGPLTQEANVDEHRQRGFYYYWDQKNFDPITHEAKFAIHFKRDGEKKRENVFTYDWRMWTIPELKEILEEAGFKKVTVYWEQSNAQGRGSGNYFPRKHGEECGAWVAYLVGQK